ncbi:MAG: hypothetical protein WC205_19085 [Opitutaceae bacterium]|jgi:hypothetical protein
MQRWKSILAPVLIFGLGMIAGGTVVTLVVVHKVRHFIDAGPDETVAKAGALVARRLDLDAAQRQTLAPVLTDLQTGFSELRLETMPKVRRLILDAETRLRPSLRPDQQAKLDQLLAAPKARWQSHIPKASPPPPPDSATP